MICLPASCLQLHLGVLISKYLYLYLKDNMQCVLPGTKRSWDRYQCAICNTFARNEIKKNTYGLRMSCNEFWDLRKPNKQTKNFEDMDLLNSWPSFKQVSGLVALSNVERNKNPWKTSSMEKDVIRFLLVLLGSLLSGPSSFRGSKVLQETLRVEHKTSESYVNSKGS